MEVEETENLWFDADAPNDLTRRTSEERRRDEIEIQETASLYSEAAVRVGLFKFLRVYCFTTGVGIVFFSAYLVIRMVIIWKIAMYSQPLSVWHLSVLVGTDVGVVVVLLSLIFLVPRMIMTWITAMVLEIIFDRKLHRGQQAVKNGKVLAREISRITLVNALKGGETAAIVAAVATLVGLTLLKLYWSGVPGSETLA